MHPKTVVRHFGSVKAAAAAIGVTDKAIYQWLDARRVPKLRRFQIESLMQAQKDAAAGIRLGEKVAAGPHRAVCDEGRGVVSIFDKPQS